MATSLIGWFAAHDAAFGRSLMGKPPEQQGQEICDRYGFDYAALHAVYEGEGRGDGDTYLLGLLNKWAEQNG